VYVSSLTIADVDVSTSTDGGASWSLNPVGATVPGDDRPWIAAVGTRKVCVSYHDVATFRIHVNCSSDAGTTFTQLGEAIDAGHAFLTEQNQIGNLVISRTAGNAIYQIMVGPTDGRGRHVGQGERGQQGRSEHGDLPVARGGRIREGRPGLLRIVLLRRDRSTRQLPWRRLLVRLPGAEPQRHDARQLVQPDPGQP